MSEKTGIQWTDSTWNCITGCDRVSEGCDHCYALREAKRLKAMGSARYQRDGNPRTSGPGFGLTLHPDKLTEPLHWKTPRRIFVNSMSDLFHDKVPDSFIADVFAVMALAPQHTFQILTKRPRRAASLLTDAFAERVRRYHVGKFNVYSNMLLDLPWPLPNVWLGVSVENQRWADQRIPLLLETPAAVRFLSCEPLIGPVDLRGWLNAINVCDDNLWDEKPIDWVIVGGESGAGYRPMALEWADQIVEQCGTARVPVFVKQLGTAWRQAGDSHGADMAYWPAELRVREMPTTTQPSGTLF